MPTKPKYPAIDEKKLKTVSEHKQAIDAASRVIMTDPKQREQFLADPVSYLKNARIPFGGNIKLTDRDKTIIKLVSDPDIATIYNSGNIAQLAEHLRQNYPGLVNDPSKVAWTVADFEVAIEAVAVAVGVFVAPIRPPEDFSEIARLEAVQGARLNAVEARLAALETQIRQLAEN
jgi:hypothetical protein